MSKFTLFLIILLVVVIEVIISRGRIITIPTKTEYFAISIYPWVPFKEPFRENVEYCLFAPDYWDLMRVSRIGWIALITGERTPIK